MDLRSIGVPLLKSLAFGLVVAHVAFFLATVVGLTGPMRIVATLVIMVLAGASIRGFRSGVGYVFGRLLWPTGTAAPYRYAYSLESSLLATGDRAGAAALLEERLRREPADLEARWRLARVLLDERPGDARAIALLREITRAPGVSAEADARATHVLVEHHLAAGETGAAMRELGRVVHRHPASDAGTFARRWLAELKAGEANG